MIRKRLKKSRPQIARTLSGLLGLNSLGKLRLNISLKFKYAKKGAVTKERIVAKSTKYFILFPR
tara:strand:+ start:351 stop:542 length:192 start_codon:yes stop_codon:yes gene_type:complete